MSAPTVSHAYFAAVNIGILQHTGPPDNTLQGSHVTVIRDCLVGYTGTHCETGECLGLSNLYTHNIIFFLNTSRVPKLRPGSCHNFSADMEFPTMFTCLYNSLHGTKNLGVGRNRVETLKFSWQIITFSNV